MHEQQALLAAIRDNPADDAPRLIYADWLEEWGDPLADLIRWQCALAAGGHERLEAAQLERRIAFWMRVHRPNLLGGFLTQHPERMVVSRGFVEALSIRGDRLLSHAEQIFAAAPLLGSLRIWNVGRQVEALVQAPCLANLHTLDLSSELLGPAGVATLFASPHLGRLQTLSLAGNMIRGPGLRAVAAGLAATQVVRLDLSVNELKHQDLIEFKRAAGLDRLSMLLLRQNPDLAEPAIALLIACGFVRSTESLYIGMMRPVGRHAVLRPASPPFSMSFVRKSVSVNI